MAGLICCWAKLPKDSQAWYQDKYVPNMCSRHARYAIHAEKTESGMENHPAGQLEAPWDLFTIYDVSDTQKATDACYDESSHPPRDLWSGPLKDARFDVRTYRELKSWRANDWDGNLDDITNISLMEWQIAPDMEDEVIHFYTSVVGPLLTTSPDVLTLRLMKIENAAVWKNGSHDTKDKKELQTFFTFSELATEQWPWDVVMQLSEMEKWKTFFEPQTIVKWHVGSYYVKETYPTGIPKQVVASAKSE